MTTSPLGRLERVDLREAWRSEAGEFTPWLAEPGNIALLGETIGVELEVEAQERSVGPFRADILCKDTITGNWVLIENQLERTDHTHLGQLLTYAAGLNAVTVVWIAQRFTDEHRAALDWLNEITGERFNFFGLEVELWKIAESPLAPKFNVVCQPNDWARSIQALADRESGGASTQTRQMQLAYWVSFAEYMKSRSSLRGQKPKPSTFMTFSVGRSGVHLDAVASTWNYQTNSWGGGENRVELVTYDRNSKAYFAELASQREAIEREIGEPLHWYNPDDYQICRIQIGKPADLNKKDDWPQQHEWLRQKLELFHRVFESRVKALGTGSPQQE